jgi:hypothetical protein
MITAAADVRGSQASSITGTVHFRRALHFGAFISVPLKPMLRPFEGPRRKLYVGRLIRFVGSGAVSVLLCFARLRPLTHSFRKRPIGDIPPLHSPVRSGTPSVAWHCSVVDKLPTSAPGCHKKGARGSYSMQPVSALLLGSTYVAGQVNLHLCGAYTDA